MNEYTDLFIHKRGIEMDKKNELLAAAREVFAEKGYKAAGISDIAKKSRMAVGSFYKYYESKEAIFLEVYIAENSRVREEIMQRVDWQGEPEAIIEQLFAVTFDEEYAKATGTKTETYNLIIAIIIAVIIVLGMNLVGSLLISALIIFPALSAMCVFGSFRAVTIWSIILSIVAALTGMFISILGGTPVGATIVTADAVMYLIFILIGKATARG